MRSFGQRRPRVCIRTTYLGATVALTIALATITLALGDPGCLFAQDKPAESSGSTQAAKAVGVIKTVQGDAIIIVVEAEHGGELTANLAASTKILRVPPGEKDLKNATAIQAQDLHPGDRVLVRGRTSADGHMMAAVTVIVMTQADLSVKQQHDREDWQKRGVGGLVTKVDAAAETITISSGGLGGNRNIVVHVAKETVLRRYAPDSVKFDDAKPALIDQIKAGDQLRARGTRSGDGSEMAAEEVVSGAFRNIAGTIKAIDSAAGTMTVQDAISKNAVVVKVSPDSQMKKLPAEMAQRIAMRLKSTAGGGSGDQPGGGGRGTGDAQGSEPGAGGARKAGESQTGHATGENGPPDFQRMLGRLPNSTLADMQKGDAVMIVSTEGSVTGAVTAITLLAGVDAILTAAPNRSASSLLSPWSLGTQGGEGEGSQ